ncbi:carbohydrate ABC transporter permease [Nakamurella endophytica]|uniref:carbohydrate ABC transporter permease n=1 Tax=Nakamurella endophytica TaxID=1748367 RepID=UPI003570BD45
MLRQLLLLALAVVVVAPFAWMVTTSLKDYADVYRPPYLWPQEFHVGNYGRAWDAAPFAGYYVNSLIMTGGILVGHVMLDTLAAYAFARLRFPLRNTLFLVLVATMLVPQFVTVLPAYDLVIRLGWYDSYAALIVPRMADVFGIVVLRAFMASIPAELDDAARLDGAGPWRSLWSVTLPLCRPALATVGMFSFLYAWNDFLWPLLVTSDDTHRTIQLGLSTFSSKYGTYPELLMAGTVTAAVPALVIFLFLQRAFIRGVASTGLK